MNREALILYEVVKFEIFNTCNNIIKQKLHVYYICIVDVRHDMRVDLSHNTIPIQDKRQHIDT